MSRVSCFFSKARMFATEARVDGLLDSLMGTI